MKFYSRRLHLPAVAPLRLALGFLLAAATLSRAAVTLKTGDDLGTTSFTGATNWSDGLAPHAGADYLVAVQYLRTPPDANSYAFAGNSLTLTNGGGMIYKGTAVNTYTIQPLVLYNGGLVRSGAGSGQTMILAGAISVLGTSVPSEIRADQSPFIVNAPISGTGDLLFSGGFTTTVNGANSFTGNTLVSGVLTLGSGSTWTFKIGAAGVNNSISGSGTVTFNGRFAFDLSGASTNVGASWNVVSTAVKNFGGTFSVDGFSKQGYGTGAGVWDLSTNGVYYEFNTANGVLSVVSTPGTPAAVSLSPTSEKFGAVEADLLAAYAPSYAAGVGGEDNAQVTIANAVAASNSDNDHSGTGARMRIVGFYQSANDVINQTTIGGLVNWLASNDSHLSDVVAQGAAVGADFVVYICQENDSVAGVSQQPGMYSALQPSAVWNVYVAHETAGHGYGRSHEDGKLNPKTIMLQNYCGGGAAPPYFYSNPNIWFNGVQLLGDGTSCVGGSQVNGGDNSFPTAANAQSVADRRSRVIVGPDLNHVVQHWLFTNAPGAAPAGTTNDDLVSGAPAVVRGNGAAYTGSALRIPGGTTGNVAMSNMSAYIDLPNGIISSRTNITIEIWATPLSAPNWARILDFGRTADAGDGLGAPGEYTGAPSDPAPGTTTASDEVLLSAAIGTDITQQRFEAMLNGTSTLLDSGLATVAGVPHYYAITFTDGAGAAGASGGRWEWYRDGDPVAYLDVSYHLAAIQDVNNWLGRSLYSADSLANNDYTEVRISDVAMSPRQVLANYLLGPAYVPTTTVSLTNSDAGGASSFNTAGQWSSGAAPDAADSYETYDFQLRTPATVGSYTFGGNTLKVSGGTLLYSGTGGGTITVTNLILNGGVVQQGGSGTCALAGNIAVSTNGAEFNAENGPINVTAPLSGLAPVTYIGNTVALSGNNAGFTGKTLIGNGWLGAVQIDSEARLGPAPAAFTSDQLTFNRGALLTTATMTLSNDNRGILLGISGGTFNVASGTTLTLASTLSSPVTAANVVAGSLTKAGAGTLILDGSNNSFNGTLNVDSGSTSANDGIIKVANNQVLANAHSPVFIRNNNGGRSTLQLDGSTGDITLPQAIALSGRNNISAAIENVAGTNTIAGGLTINVGGGYYWIQSDAGLLNLGGTLTSAATGTRTLTFLGNGDLNVTGSIADGSASISVVKSGSGTLTLGGAGAYSGATTVSAGTLLVNGSTGTGSVTVGNTATLSGNGTIQGAVTVQYGATLMPGASSIAMGALSMNNAATLQSGSVTRMKISRATHTNDVLNVAGTLTYGGTLVVTNLAGTLAAGDSFRLFNAATSTGAFTAMNLPSLSPGQEWNFDAASGLLRVISTAPVDLTFTVAGNELTLSWPADHLGWILQAQTNTLAAGLSTNWFDVSGSDAGTTNIVTINPAAPATFYRLRQP